MEDFLSSMKLRLLKGVDFGLMFVFIVKDVEKNKMISQ